MKEPDDESDLWREDARTGSDGYFEMGSTTSPSPVHALLRVVKDGFGKVDTLFLHPSPRPGGSPSAHRVTVLLTRRP